MAAAATTKARSRILSAGSLAHDGWTFQLGLGGGMQIRDLDEGGSADGGIIAGPSLAFGYFVRDWVAVMVRSGMTLALPEGDATVVLSGMLGPTVQFWPLAWLKVEAGLGFGYHRDDADAEDGADLGLAALGGLGIVFWQDFGNALRIDLGYMPLLLERSSVQAFTAELVWQVF